MKVVLASFNPDKLRELEALIQMPGVFLVGLHQYPSASPPPETGETVEENARIKARAAVRATGLPAIADDTGLEVDALGGLPGVRAARLAGPKASYSDNVRRLLELLTGVEPPRRTARFRTVCVACFPDGEEVAGEGILEGWITNHPRGSGAFGYDPVFEVADLGRTLAELTDVEKNAISHRARAVRDLMARLDKLRK